MTNAIGKGETTFNEFLTMMTSAIEEEIEKKLEEKFEDADTVCM